MQKIITSIPFLLIALGLAVIGRNNSFESYNTAFITGSIAVGLFAVNFSFLQYGFSPYKSILRTINSRQVWYSVLVIILSLTPLIALAVDVCSVGLAAFMTLPMLTYSAIFLWIIAREESSPAVLTKRIINEKSLDLFVKSYLIKKKELSLSNQKFDFSSLDEAPLHDFRSASENIYLESDPFNLIYNIIVISISNSDTHIYDSSLKNLFLTCDRIKNLPNAAKGDYVALEEHFFVILKRISISTFELDKTGLFSYRFLTICDSYIRYKSSKILQTQKIVYETVSIAVDLTKRILSKSEWQRPLTLISCCRNICQKGMHDKKRETGSDGLFFARLEYLPSSIKLIGQEAIKQKDSDYLFRCLEELGYIGVSAIKNNLYQLVRSCVQFLVQLGRESRAGKIQCFWQSCALEPWQHAEERIWWIFSWLRCIPEDNREMYVGLFERAYSRLNGKEINFSIEIENDQLIVSQSSSGLPHQEQIISNRYVSLIDYSNPENIKEHKLY
jgi:hypothetical protein